MPYPSVVAMQAVVDQIAGTNPKAKSVDAKNYVNDRYLKRLEEEGFVKKIWENEKPPQVALSIER